MTPAVDGVEGDEAAGGAGVALRPGRLGRVRHLQVSRLSNLLLIIIIVARLDGEAEDYRLWVGGYSGNASDSLSAHNGFKFSTIDR